MPAVVQVMSVRVSASVFCILISHCSESPRRGPQIAKQSVRWWTAAVGDTSRQTPKVPILSWCSGYFTPTRLPGSPDQNDTQLRSSCHETDRRAPCRLTCAGSRAHLAGQDGAEVESCFRRAGKPGRHRSTKGLVPRMPRHDRSADPAANESPVIWRCSGCGAIVHVSDDDRPVASCSRCGHIVGAVRDGGPS